MASAVNADEAVRIMQGVNDSVKGFGRTGELSLARRAGDLIQFLLHRRHDHLISLKPMPVAAMQDTPIGRALLGLSGSMVGVDNRGTQVLAAYEPLPTLGWGIVAKIDVSEIREPFVKAGILAGGVALLVLLGGVGLFFQLCDPLIRRLEAREFSTQAILDTAPDGIITFDSRGAIQSVNHAAEQLFGYTGDEVMGQPIARLMPSILGEYGDYSPQSGLARSLSTGLGAVQEMTGRRRDGTNFPAEVALSEMRIDDRRLFTGVVRDITQRKRLQAQLRQSQKMQAIGTLVGGIAHNFNNVLAVILGYSELALLKVPRQSPAKRYLDDVLAAVQRARELVAQILTLNRQAEVERKPVHLASVVREALSFLRTSLPTTIEIRHHADP